MAYLLRCEKLTKEYGKAGSLVRAVNRANICFPQKGLIAISGKSGCGKSTLLSLLASLEKPTKGRIFFQGEDISNYPPDKLAKYRGQCTGMIFQHYNLFEDDTALQNVELPLLINGYSRKDARSIALKTMQDFMMQAFADRKVSTLSGGEKQRIAICRAMASAPKILFADEPTGALDEHNSKLVMDALKRMAQSILVIIVSHNGQLIEEYADAIIHMASGKIIDKPTFIQDKGTAKKLRPHSNSFVSRFVKKNMKANKANGILCGFASSVGFLSLCITLGYFYGSRAAVDELPLRCYDSSVASLCVEEKIETDSAIALVQQVRPEIEAASNYVGPDFIVDYDLSYFFPKAYAYSLNGVAHDPIMFSPVYDLSPNYGYGGLLEEGSPTSSLDMDVCLINDLLFEQLGPDCIGQSIEMEFANQVTSYGASDEVRIAVKMEIMGVVNEFSFLNEPKIYYSYMAAKNSLLSFELQNAGMAYGRELTALDVVAQAPGDSATSGFSLNVFAKNFNQSKKLFDFMAKEQTDGYSIQSRSYSAYSSFASLTGAFETCLFLFVGVSGMMLVIMLSMSAYAAFSKRKKDASILYCLGGKRGDLMSMFAFESSFHSVLGCAAGLMLSPLAAIGINLLMKNSFDIANIVQIPFAEFLGVPYLLPVLCVAAAALISVISTGLVLLVAGRFSIVEELRDE